MNSKSQNSEPYSSPKLEESNELMSERDSQKNMINKYYDFLELLGEGSFCKVYRAI